ncbi:MAG: putative CRISPR-associated protein [Ignisphaera sp.]
MGCAVYISPVGTSLLANFWRDRGGEFVSRYRDLSEWSRLSPNDARNAYPDGSVCRALEDGDLIYALVDYGSRFRERSCAEVNGVLGIQKIFGHSPGDTLLYLLYTKTCNTSIAAHALMKVFSLLGFSRVSPIELKGIASVDEFDRGLIEVLDRVSSIIGSHRGRCRIYVNATPGFKAETSFVALVSLLLGVDGVVYIHESFDQPVLLPYIPLSIDVNELKQLLDVFGGEDRVHINAFISAVDYGRYLDYRERGLIMVEHEYVRLRPWIKTLISIATERM